jgi:hypothetical protein
MPRALALVLACLVLGACSNEIDVDYRGRRQIVEGDFRIALPLLFGSERYVLAGERDTPGLRLLPFEGGDGCDLGPGDRAVAYWTPDGLRIGVYDELDDGTLSVRFLDKDCEMSLGPVDGLIDTSFSTGLVLGETHARQGRHAPRPVRARRIGERHGRLAPGRDAPLAPGLRRRADR